MDYARFAIIVWIIATIFIAIVGRKPFSKIFGMPQNKVLKIELRAYLSCSMMLGGAVSMVITSVIRAFS